MRIDSIDKGNLRRATVVVDNAADTVTVTVWNGHGVLATSEPVDMTFFGNFAAIAVAVPAGFGLAVGNGSVDTSCVQVSGTTEALGGVNPGVLRVDLTGSTAGAHPFIVKVGGLIFSGSVTV